MDFNRDHRRPPRLRSGASALAVALLLICVSAASAADPLLSGYSGPGGGEQVVLGSKLLTPASSGPIRRTSPAPAVSSETNSGTKERSDADRDSAKQTAVPDPAASQQPATTQQPVVPVTAAYPSSANSVSGLPLERSDVLVLAFAALAVCGTAILLTRLRRVSVG